MLQCASFSTSLIMFNAMRLLLLITAFLVPLMTHANVIIPKAPSLDAKAYILMDAASGRILVEKNAHERIAPASLTKMMTSYVALHELQLGNITEDTLIPVSVKAWQMGGSKMFIREGTQVPLIDLLRGIIVQSGNDASIAVAEYFSGSEENYAAWMNQFAHSFGMNDTHFVNVTGWPAENHYTSAHDMAQLSLHIIKDHPEYYGLYAEKYFEYNKIRQPNRNRLLWQDATVDGLKTGHTDEAGYCLAASAKRDNTRFIAIIMGARSEASRATETQKLLAYGFRYFETKKVYSANQTLKTEKVWLGTADHLDLTLANDLFLTLPRGIESELSVKMNANGVLKAPIKKGQVLGKISVSYNDELLAEEDLIAATDIQEAGFFGRLWGHIKLFFASIFA